MPKTLSHDLHEAGFQLYLDGQSPEQIARQLNVGKNTPARWCEKYGWEARRDAIRAKSQKKLDRKLVDRSARIIAQLDELQEQIGDEMAKTKFMSKEGAIGAFLNVSKRLMDLVPKEVGLKDEAWNAIVKVLNSFPDIRALLDKHSAELSQRLEKALGDL